jgi:hypothetical protein
MNRRWYVIAALGLAALALAQVTHRIVINGKLASGSAMTVKGEVYVPLKALQAAGIRASVSGGVLNITLPGEGGSNQSGALEGGVNDWLFNGIWRFRVLSITPLAEERTGWAVQVELRNGTKADNIALSGTGLSGINLVLNDGKIVTPYNVTDISDVGFVQGGGKALSLTFYEDEIGGRKPDKFLLLIKPDSALNKYLKESMKISYSVPDPSFRVKF